MTEEAVWSRYVHAEMLPWHGLYPGVESKTLRRNTTQNLVVMQMRYQPGAVIPKHRHAVVEHVFVLEG